MLEGGTGVNRRSPITIAVIIGILGLLFSQLLALMRSYMATGDGADGAVWYEGLAAFFSQVWPLVQLISFLLSVLLVIAIMYLRQKLIELRREESKELTPVTEAQAAEEEGVLPGATEGDVPIVTNPRWESVQAYAQSENPNDWRHAIMEADILLDEMLERMSYEGEGVGEKLKQIEKSDVRTLDMAWEAHKVRNAIAHEGASFRLTQRETRRVIDLYRQVFEEFNFI